MQKRQQRSLLVLLPILACLGVWCASSHQSSQQAKTQQRMAKDGLLSSVKSKESKQAERGCTIQWKMCVYVCLFAKTKEEFNDGKFRIERRVEDIRFQTESEEEEEDSSDW